MNINHCNINKGTKPHKVVPPPSYKLAISPLTIDISPTKTRVKLELCSPTERYRTGAPPCKILIFLRSSNKTVATRRPGDLATEVYGAYLFLDVDQPGYHSWAHVQLNAKWDDIIYTHNVIYIYVYMYIYIHIDMCIYICICISIYIYVCMYNIMLYIYIYIICFGDRMDGSWSIFFICCGAFIHGPSNGVLCSWFWIPSGKLT